MPELPSIAIAACTLWVALVLSAPATADLRGTNLSSLIAQSELIALANVDSSERRPDGSGFAVLTIERTIKGTAPTEPLRLQWSSEVHEQRIPPPPATLLLFLKRHDGRHLSGTHYGRSYWTVETDDAAGAACRRYTRYVYPVDMLRVDSPELKRRLLRTLPGGGSPPVEVLCLDDPTALLTTIGE